MSNQVEEKVKRTHLLVDQTCSGINWKLFNIAFQTYHPQCSKKIHKTRLLSSGGNFNFLGKVFSGWMIHRINYDLIQLHFKSTDNFARGVKYRNKIKLDWMILHREKSFKTLIRLRCQFLRNDHHHIYKKLV